MMLPGSTPLSDAKAAVWADAYDEGTGCPCCGQLVKVYRRSIHSAMAYTLIRLYQEHGTEWGDWVPILKEAGAGGGDHAKLAYWGLVEPQPDLTRDDGSNRTGIWRVTEKGVKFVQNRIWVPKYALVYNGQLLKLEGVPWTVVGALGKKFRYDELMRGN